MKSIMGFAVFQIISLVLMALAAFAVIKPTVKPLSFEGRIVFVGIGGNIFMLDGHSEKISKITDNGDNYSPRWSPDGKWIAYEHMSAGNQGDIYITNADGGKPRRVTTTRDGISSNPRWNPAGDEIYFSSNIKGNFQENVVYLRTGEVRTLNAIGKTPEVKAIPLEELRNKPDEELKKMAKQAATEMNDSLKSLSGEYQIYPSPDDVHYLIHYPHALMGQNSAHSLILVNKKDKTKKYFDHGGSPAWSKDSQTFTYFIGSEPRDTIAIYDVQTKQQIKIKVPKGKNEGCAHPAWSRYVSNIVFDCSPVAGPGKAWLYVIDLKKEKTTRLAEGFNPDWY